MTLNIIWFILIAILYAGYFVLEGFDLGVGILLPFLGKNDLLRRTMLNTIGPHWDGNEVWLITAGGATFAAFPHWYATLFSGFYLPLFVMLLGLIVRAVAFEFRSKLPHPNWRGLWDFCITAGSLIPAVLWGVAFGNFLRGVPIDAHMNYVGGFWNLLNPYALVAGVASLSLFTLQGSIYLALKTETPLKEAAHKQARGLWIVNVVVLILLTVLTYRETDILTQLGVNPGVVPVLGAVAALAVGVMLARGRDGWAFILSTLSILCITATAFMELYPRLMVSSLNPEWSLTITNAASGTYTLQVMSIVAAIFIPLILIYQGWSYWVFRQRVGSKEGKLEY